MTRRRAYLISFMLIAGLCGFWLFLHINANRDSTMIVSLPVPLAGEITINNVPPESDTVCISVCALSSNEWTNWSVDVKRHRARKVTITAPRRNGLCYRRLRCVKGAYLVYDDFAGAHRVSRAGTRKQTLVMRGSMHPDFGRFEVVSSPSAAGQPTRSWLTDLYKWTTVPLPTLPVESDFFPHKGNGKTPVVFWNVRGKGRPRRTHTEFWLIDAHGRISQRLKWGKGWVDSIALDGEGNLYTMLMDENEVGNDMWLCTPGMSSPRRMMHLPSGLEGSRLQGTAHGVCLLSGPSPKAWAEKPYWWLSRLRMERASRNWGIAMYPYIVGDSDLWYVSPNENRPTLLAHRVKASATSPEGNTVFFIRGRELRSIDLSRQSSFGKQRSED